MHTWLLLHACTHDGPRTPPVSGQWAAHQSALRLRRRPRLVRGCWLGAAGGSGSASAMHGDSTRGFTGVDGASSSLCHAGETGASRSVHDARQSMFIAATVPAQPQHRRSCGFCCSCGTLQRNCLTPPELQLSSPLLEHQLCTVHQSALQTRQPVRQCPRCALQTPNASLVYLHQLPYVLAKVSLGHKPRTVVLEGVVAPLSQVHLLAWQSSSFPTVNGRASAPSLPFAFYSVRTRAAIDRAGRGSPDFEPSVGLMRL